MDTLQNILIVGGTHGNEMTGIQLVRHWNELAFPDFQTLSVQTLIGNPGATERCLRYVDFDLNRAFTPELLDIRRANSSFDIERARWINQHYGPKGSKQAPDLVIDIHNSTANMGQCLIVNRLDPRIQRICSILSSEIPSVHILYQPEELSAIPYLPSLGKLDLTVEIGPQPHGTLKASLFQQTRQLLLRILTLCDLSNQGLLPSQPQPTQVFTQTGVIDYPRDENSALAALIHPSLENRDFSPINTGDVLFEDFAGNAIPWDGPLFWPCFLGEAAYLEKHIAMTQLTLSTENW